MTSFLSGKSARYGRLAAPAAAAITHGLRMAVNLLVIKFIAVIIGPAGLGLLGNLMSAATIVALFAGGGILNGITKYVAEYHVAPELQQRFLNSAAAYGLTAGCVVLLGSIVAAKPLSLALFGEARWAWIIPLLGLTNLLSFIGGGIIAVVNGKRQPLTFAAISILAYVGAIPAAYLLIKLGGLSGAAIALLMIVSATAVPAVMLAWWQQLLGALRPRFDWADTKKLFRFTCIAAISSITFPVTEILIRFQLTETLGFGDTGIWQAMARLSGAILGFYTVFLTTSYMPRLSATPDRHEAARIVVRSLMVIGPIFAACALLIYLARSIVVPLLFADAFRTMEHVIGWQLVGDLLRVCSYVIAFLGTARAALKLHIAAELIQCALYFVLTTVALKMGYGLEGVAQAYATTYAIYFAITLIALREYVRR